MRHNLALLPLTFALAVALALPLAHPAAAQVPGGSVLSGSVCTQQNVYYIRAPDQPNCGSGLPNATVTLHADLGLDRTQTTDENGQYAFKGVADGTYTVSAVRTGFDAAKVTVKVSGETKQDVVLQPQDIAQKGIVVDADGVPIQGAQVNACCSPNGNSAQTTDEEGGFVLKLPAGSYSIHTEAPGFVADDRQQLLDGSGTVRVALAHVPPQDAFVHGRVLDQHGEAVVGIQVNVYSYDNSCCMDAKPMPPETCSSDGTCSSSGSATMPPRPYYGGSNWTKTDAQGRYAIHVYSGQLSLNLYDDKYASYSDSFAVAHGASVTHDITLQKFPAKTAHVAGQVVDAHGKPLAGAYVSVNSPQFGRYECSSGPDQPTPVPMPMAAEDAPQSKPAMYPGPAYNGCAITVHADGTFEGFVTPGYSVLTVNVPQKCDTTQNEGGSGTTTCGPEYLPFVRTMVLPENANTTLHVTILARAGPDAIVSGYLVDHDTQQAIAHATISFSNAETYGYGSATTDGDGSYKIQLRSGYHTVTVYADGHFHWEGTLQVKAGDNSFDVTLTPGHEANSCCIMYAGRGVATPGMAGPASAEASGGGASGGNMAQGAPAPAMPAADGSKATGSASPDYKDLGGGLGKYDASQRAQAAGSAPDTTATAKKSPDAGLALMAGALVAGLAVRRRLA